uniref:FHA domain-containing protein n=1 Tax=Rhodosorus marinus TaxID=101924 RepID=A0A7S3A7L8_9RHOD|mmetsp:Transcript_6349/g.27043  ORF Transcript_6349/g.27043 Transcript_6349/m.27043 type:complete len:838 (+) Transcript_6349:279-2792(+)
MARDEDANGASFGPDHYCFQREASSNVEVEDRFREVASVVSKLVNSGSTTSEAVQEAETRYGGDLNIIAGESWDFGGNVQDVLVLGCAISTEEILIFMENVGSTPITAAPRLSDMKSLSPNSKEGILWELSDMAKRLPSETIRDEELSDVKYFKDLSSWGGSALFRLRILTPDETTSEAIHESRVDALLRVQSITSKEEASRNLIVAEIVGVLDDSRALVRVVHNLAVLAMPTDRDMPIEVGKLMRDLVYLVTIVTGSVEAGLKLGWLLEILARLGSGAKAVDFAREFLRNDQPPVAVIACGTNSSQVPWRGEMAAMAENLANALDDLGWIVVLVTCCGPKDTLANATKLGRGREGGACDVFALKNSAVSSAHSHYVVRTVHSIWEAPKAERSDLCRLFAQEGLKTLKEEKIRPGAVFSCGWAATQFPELRFGRGFEGNEGASLSQFFASTEFVHLVEPHDIGSVQFEGGQDGTLLALEACRSWGTIGMPELWAEQSESVKKKLKLILKDREQDGFHCRIGCVIDQRAALISHLAARKELVRRNLVSGADNQAVVCIQLSVVGRSDGASAQAVDKTLKEIEGMILGPKGGSFMFLFVPSSPSSTLASPASSWLISPSTSTQPYPGLAQLRRNYPKRVAIVPADLRRYAFTGADCVLLSDSSRAFTNGLRGIGTKVLFASDADWIKRLSSMGQLSSRSQPARAAVVATALPLQSVVESWSEQLQIMLKHVPVSFPADFKYELEATQKASWAFLDSRTSRIDVTRLGAKRVNLVGSFNDWSGQLQMTGSPKDGKFRIKLRLPRRKHLFKLVVDGEWTTDSRNPEEIDANGFKNNYIVVS